ncbi:hypothetical protein BD626DRAFT_634153 [Schizophyllum amplum]|uniref:Uncharacterized protein n=1 Tax=Schizophyllum amplum TaxID=97359 RepID=A0A550C0I6_9AGAR|nr:hypothetical protein BD626DRAFT_634153 [Auriculariopsis ampla]
MYHCSQAALPPPQSSWHTPGGSSSSASEAGISSSDEYGASPSDEKRASSANGLDPEFARTRYSLPSFAKGRGLLRDDRRGMRAMIPLPTMDFSLDGRRLGDEARRIGEVRRLGDEEHRVLELADEDAGEREPNAGDEMDIGTPERGRAGHLPRLHRFSGVIGGVIGMRDGSASERRRVVRPRAGVAGGRRTRPGSSPSWEVDAFEVDGGVLCCAAASNSGE